MIPEEPGIIRATQTLRDNGYQSLRVIYNEYQSLRVIHNGYQSLRVIPNLTLFWGFLRKRPRRETIIAYYSLELRIEKLGLSPSDGESRPN